jgi:hypothetical protein
MLTMRLVKGQQKRHKCRTVAFVVLGVALALWTLLQVTSSITGGPRKGDPTQGVPSEKPSAQHMQPYELPQKSSRDGDHHLQLLLSTHNRLFWYVPDTGEEIEVHQGHGVYYGCFSDDPTTHKGPPNSIWVVSRPHNWHPKDTEEAMLHLKLPSGQELERKRLPTRFTHDAIRVGNTVYVCDTGEGKVVELDFPSMSVKRILHLFTPKEHINTVSAFGDGTLWVVLHNLGQSLLAQVDLRSGKVTRRIPKIGVNSHGLVLWRSLFVMLSSMETALITVDPETEKVSTVWQGQSGFLKGLIVVDDVAYFGKSPPMKRQDRDGPKVQCDLVAVDLVEKKLLFVHKVNTRGLLNIISAPQLAVTSTYIAQHTRGQDSNPRALGSMLGQRQNALLANPLLFDGLIESTDKDEKIDDKRGRQNAPLQWAVSWLTHPLSKDSIGGHWSTGMPYMNIAKKGAVAQAASQEEDRDGGGHGGRLRLHARRRKSPHGSKHTTSAGHTPYLHLGKMPKELLQPLKDRIDSMPKEWWDAEAQKAVSAEIDGREQNLQSTKPGVSTIFLLFSTRDADRVWHLPLYSYFKKQLEPVVRAVLGEDAMDNIVRLQFALMAPGSHIRPHRDAGLWAKRSHRLHIVLKTHGGISFTACPQCPGLTSDTPECKPPPKGLCIPLDTCENCVFEVDNLYIHEVTNSVQKPRIHLVIDVAEQAAPDRFALQVGQVCRYAANMNSPRFTPGC